jgi:hypothetical protein
VRGISIGWVRRVNSSDKDTGSCCFQGHSGDLCAIINERKIQDTGYNLPTVLCRVVSPNVLSVLFGVPNTRQDSVISSSLYSNKREYWIVQARIADSCDDYGCSPSTTELVQTFFPCGLRCFGCGNCGVFFYRSSASLCLPESVDDHKINDILRSKNKPASVHQACKVRHH